MIQSCTICGNDKFESHDVLWKELIDDWGLESDEVEYINKQQGYCCTSCGNNLRSMALAFSICRSYGMDSPLDKSINRLNLNKLRILEVNEAGGLTPILSSTDHHMLIMYPEYDMTNLNISSNSVDLVVHSDTLEHIPEPIAGLAECYRVLKPGGRCLFTVPVVIGRLSRSRLEMKNSYHGDSTTKSDDYIVHTEFGADIWLYVMRSGFSEVRLHCLDFPSGLVVEGKKA